MLFEWDCTHSNNRERTHIEWSLTQAQKIRLAHSLRYPSKILASSESTSLEKHHVSLAFPNQFVLRSPHVIAAGYKPISHTNACPSLMTYVRDKGVSFQGTGATDKQLEVSLVVEIDNGSLPSDKILNDWGPNMLSCGERPGRGSDAFDTMTRRIRNARFADVHEKDYKSPMRPWPRNQEMKGAGMVNFQHSMNEIRGLVYVVAHKVWPPATLESPCVCREAAKRAQRRFHICIKVSGGFFCLSLWISSTDERYRRRGEYGRRSQCQDMCRITQKAFQRDYRSNAKLSIEGEEYVKGYTIHSRLIQYRETVRLRTPKLLSHDR